MKEQKLPDTWLTCSSVLEWHNWLNENHSSSDGIWLLIQKTRSKHPGLFLDQAVIEAICSGWIDSKMHSLDADSFILWFSPRKSKSLWSLKNRIRAEKLLADGRMTAAGLQTIKDAQASGSWQAAYTSLKKPELPEDLVEALEMDLELRRKFDSWSNSDQLQVAFWIGQASRTQTRLKRIDTVLNWIREGGLPPDIYRK